MKKRFSIVFFTVLLCMLVCTGCNISFGNSGTYRYSDANKYSVGSAQISAEGINRISIDWINGDICLKEAEGTEISITEETNETDENYFLRYAVINGELKIKYQAADTKTKSNFSKRLAVALPSASRFSEMKIDAVNADIEVSACTTVELDIDTVNGDIAVGAGVSQDIEIDTVNGNVLLFFAAEECFRVEYDTVNGRVHDSCGATKQGNTYTFGTAGVLAEVDTVNGNLTLNRT